MGNRRITLDEQVAVMQCQGATHRYSVSTNHIRVYRYRGGRWQGRSLDGGVGGWIACGKWTNLPGELPSVAERID